MSRGANSFPLCASSGGGGRAASEERGAASVRESLYATRDLVQAGQAKRSYLSSSRSAVPRDETERLLPPPKRSLLSFGSFAALWFSASSEGGVVEIPPFISLRKQVARK